MVFNEYQIKKPFNFTLLLFLYTGVSYGLIIVLNLFFSIKNPMYELSPLIGGLLAGMNYGSKTKEMSSIKLRLISSVVSAVVVILLMVAVAFKFGELSFSALAENWISLLYAFLIFTLGTLFTLFLGNRNKLRAMEFKKNIGKNDR